MKLRDIISERAFNMLKEETEKARPVHKPILDVSMDTECNDVCIESALNQFIHINIYDDKYVPFRLRIPASDDKGILKDMIDHVVKHPYIVYPSDLTVNDTRNDIGANKRILVVDERYDKDTPIKSYSYSDIRNLQGYTVEGLGDEVAKIISTSNFAFVRSVIPVHSFEIDDKVLETVSSVQLRNGNCFIIFIDGRINIG